MNVIDSDVGSNSNITYTLVSAFGMSIPFEIEGQLIMYIMI